MADAITFTPYLGWVDVPNPNEPAQEARFITAADLKRYEIFGRDAAALLNAHESSLAAAVTRFNTLDTNLGAVNTRLNNSATGLDAKAPKASPTFTGTVSGISKAMVGLGNVDNTADTAKPVSTVQKTYIDAVGSRVGAIERRVNLTSTQAESQPIRSSGPETLVLQLSPVTVVAGRSYKITRSGNFHGMEINMAGDVHVKSSAPSASGVNGNDPRIVPSTTIWGSSSIPRGGNAATFVSTWYPTVSGTFRLYLSFTRTVGSANVYMELGSWNLYVEETP